LTVRSYHQKAYNFLRQDLILTCWGKDQFTHQALGIFPAGVADYPVANQFARFRYR
jgi:hypothetical protein